ncbi:hypothetical protein JCM6882_003908 [Rhodosporidiobolus microsporus]
MVQLENASRLQTAALKSVHPGAIPSRSSSSTSAPALSRELLTSIAAYADPPTLTRLARTSKLLYSVAMPLLQKRITLRTYKAWTRYERTMQSWIAPWVRKQVGQGKIRLWETDEELQLTLDLDANEKLSPFFLPDLSFLPSANLFSSLTSLSIQRTIIPSDFIASLLGPRRPARRTLKTLQLQPYYPCLPDRNDSPLALAFILQMLDLLPHEYYIICEGAANARDELEQKQLRRKSSWDKLNRLVHSKPVHCDVDDWLKGYCVPYGQHNDDVDQLQSDYDPFPIIGDFSLRDGVDCTLSMINAEVDSFYGESAESNSDESYETDDLDREDDLSLFELDDEDRYLCHLSSPTNELTFRSPRKHDLRVPRQLAQLSETTSTSEAFALFSKLLRLPGRRICNACLSLPSFLVNHAPSSSPFSNLTFLTWTLSFYNSRDEDLLILLGTDLVKGVKDDPSSPPGRLIPPTRTILPDRATAASLGQYFAAPPVPSPPPTPPTKSTAAMARYKLLKNRSIPPPYPPEKEDDDDPHAPKPFKASWIAHLTAAEREGEELVQRYRGPKLSVLDASEVKVGRAGE